MLDAVTPTAVEAFHRSHHTFSHYQSDGVRSTCRLDRWYVDSAHYELVGNTNITEPSCHTDHQAVFLELFASGGERRRPKRRKRRRGLRYPLHREDVALVQELFLEQIQPLIPQLLEMSPADSAEAWNNCKDSFRRSCLVEIRRRAAARRAATRQRVRRLREAIANEQRRGQVHSEAPDVVERTREHVDRLTLEPQTRYRELCRALIDTHRRRAHRQRRRKFGLYQGTSPAAVRAFYRCISIKYNSRRHVPALPLRTGTTSQADAMAQDWTPIIQKHALDPEKQDTFFAALPKRSPMVGPTVFDAPFTETEVATALKGCHRRKAGGPDGIPNDFYRDIDGELPPLLAPLFWK